MSKLTPRQQRFIAEYVKDLNGTQAAIRAGYAAKHASAQSYQLLQKTTVQDAIAKFSRQHMLRAGITAQDVIAGLHEEATRMGEGSSHSARVQAWTQLGRYHGLFDNRVERSVTHKLSDLSDEELVEWTERLLRGEELPEFLQ
jgi:phage terminase small subunit